MHVALELISLCDSRRGHSRRVPEPVPFKLGYGEFGYPPFGFGAIPTLVPVRIRRTIAKVTRPEALGGLTKLTPSNGST